jgi:adenylosuccinate synthase
MPNTILMGAQWGDEGKGKVIDVLTSQADVIVRYQGGSNAGHTVITEGKKYVLHLIPSGILHEGKQCVIGNGVVMDPFDLLTEIEMLRGHGISTDGRLFISDRTHMVMQWHRALDKADEARRSSDKKIGTTGRGIGPAYSAKMGRQGFRVGDLLRPDFLERVRETSVATNVRLGKWGLSFWMWRPWCVNMPSWLIFCVPSSRTPWSSSITLTVLARAFCSKARRGPCWISTLEPILM